jgi:hypothetical protein
LLDKNMSKQTTKGSASSRKMTTKRSSTPKMPKYMSKNVIKSNGKTYVYYRVRKDSANVDQSFKSFTPAARLARTIK